MPLIRQLMVSFAFALAAAPTIAQNIDTTTSWDGSVSISSFGVPDTATYGQTIVIPAGQTKLYDFSFQMRLPTTVVYRGYVYAWDAVNNIATGPALFESAPSSTSQAAAFEEVTFTSPAGISVTPGQQYVLFASVSKDHATGSGTGVWGGGNLAYSDGAFVYINNGADDSQWTTQVWNTWSSSDLAFTASFTPSVTPTTAAVPVPASSALGLSLLSLLLGASVVMRSRTGKL